MSFKILDYQAVEPRNTTNPTVPEVIPQSPNHLQLATLTVTIPKKHHTSSTTNNKVELIATVGVEGLTGISQLIFRILRDGAQIFDTQAGVESADSEQFYAVTFQAIDTKLRSGSHTYEVTVENATPGTTAAVVGPISFSALAIERKDFDESSD